MQLLGVFASDADNLPSLMFSLGSDVSGATKHPDGDVWSLGYYAQDRALVIRKPGELVDSRQFYELASEVRSRVLVGFISDGHVNTPHTPPHRFRNWLFGATGAFGGLVSLQERIEERLPDFIRSELGFETGSELAFGMFLRELHERNFLDNALVTSSKLAEALAKTSETIQMLCEEAGQPVVGGLLATNGRCLLVNAQGRELHWRVQEGLEQLPEGPPDPNIANFKLIVEGLKRFRAVLIAGEIEGEGPGWASLSSGQTCWVDRQLDLQIVDF